VKDGQVDIVVGTHAILAKGIEFKNLGLVIVDEEQRFGVTHKERLKGLRADVHVLTLTATPIPRTLQMAMSGLRELSVIQTPPVDRWRSAPTSCRGTRWWCARRCCANIIAAARASSWCRASPTSRHRGVPARGSAGGPLRRRHGQMAPTEVEERMSAFLRPQLRGLVSPRSSKAGSTSRRPTR
jgi:transcription-repair coupling factor (superfamily II helicase)